MKCNLCGQYYNEKKHYRCFKCFPEVETKQGKKTTEALNKGQLAMVYGEVKK